MAEFSSFFNSLGGDRRYSASAFAEYFASFLSDGVFNGGESLQVYANDSDYKLRVKVGKAWAKGYYYRLSEAEKVLTPSQAHNTMPRIDRIVLKLDISQEARFIRAEIKEGTAASSPVAPDLERDMTGSGVYELSLGQVLIPAGASVIPAANVVDERLDNELCGLVNSLIQADTTNIFNQFQAYFNNTVVGDWGQFKLDWDSWLNQTKDEWNNWFGDTNLAWDNWFIETKSDYNAWYSGIKTQIFDAIYYDFNNWRYRAGHSYVTRFDEPEPGNILVEIKNTLSDEVVASMRTEFMPSGDIVETLHIAEDDITVAKTTIFNPDGSITEVIS